MRTPKHSLVEIGRAVVAYVQDPSGSKGPDARELCFAFSTPGFVRACPNEFGVGAMTKQRYPKDDCQVLYLDQKRRRAAGDFVHIGRRIRIRRTVLQVDEEILADAVGLTVTEHLLLLVTTNVVGQILVAIHLTNADNLDDRERQPPINWEASFSSLTEP